MSKEWLCCCMSGYNPIAIQGIRMLRCISLLAISRSVGRESPSSRGSQKRLPNFDHRVLSLSKTQLGRLLECSRSTLADAQHIDIIANPLREAASLSLKFGFLIADLCWPLFGCLFTEDTLRSRYITSTERLSPFLPLGYVSVEQ